MPFHLAGWASVSTQLHMLIWPVRVCRWAYYSARVLRYYWWHNFGVDSHGSCQQPQPSCQCGIVSSSDENTPCNCCSIPDLVLPQKSLLAQYSCANEVLTSMNDVSGPGDEALCRLLVICLHSAFTRSDLTSRHVLRQRLGLRVSDLALQISPDIQSLCRCAQKSKCRHHYTATSRDDIMKTFRYRVSARSTHAAVCKHAR